MSLAQDSYLSPSLHTTAPPTMNINTMLQNQQSYEPYPQVPEGSHPAEQSPQIQLPPQPIAMEPQDVSTVHEGRIYSLDIKQQPIRARMCGFGDKDRRPITPPPCIRLIVRDALTKQEIDIAEIDTSYFVLSVDLWSADASTEVNLVRHSSTSPSISAATAASYPPNTSSTPVYHQGTSGQFTEMYQQSPVSPQGYQPMNMATVGMQQPIYTPSYSTNVFPKQSELVHYQQAFKQQDVHQTPPTLHHHHLPTSQASTQLAPAQSMSEQVRGYYTSGPGTPSNPAQQISYYPGQGQASALLSPDHIPNTDPRAQPGGMFTRNLIGSLCVSAFKLADPDNNIGVWFVLQDLSVRTEGSFRLKMNFVNVGQTPSSVPTTPSSQSFGPNASGAGGGTPGASFGVGKLNTGSAPVLASCFSNSFEVFSAKKFPGVIESTKLSKCFATQGIKIPIRKDGLRGNERARMDDDDE